MNFQIVSLNEQGKKLEHAGEQPSFYMLTLNGQLVDYYTSVRAAQLAAKKVELLTPSIKREIA